MILSLRDVGRQKGFGACEGPLSSVSALVAVEGPALPDLISERSPEVQVLRGNRGVLQVRSSCVIRTNTGWAKYKLFEARAGPWVPSVRPRLQTSPCGKRRSARLGSGADAAAQCGALFTLQREPPGEFASTVPLARRTHLGFLSIDLVSVSSLESAVWLGCAPR